MDQANDCELPRLCRFSRNSIWLNSYSPVHLNILSSESETGMPLPDSLTRWVADLRYLLDKVQIPNDAGARRASGIIQGTARVVSDG
jgi:hypothetical protein